MFKKSHPPFPKQLRILFFITYPREDAASRYRVYQFLNVLHDNNIHSHVSCMLSKKLYRIKNAHGFLNAFLKIALISGALIKRVFALVQVFRYDIVFIHREVFPFFTPVFEMMVRKMNSRIIFDFDDAIYTKPTHNPNWRDYLRKPENVSKICEFAAAVTVGNENLFNYALRYNRNVCLLPTVFRVQKNNISNLNPRTRSEQLRIGWIGSWSTLNSLYLIRDALERIILQNPTTMLKIVGAENIFGFSLDISNVEYKLWNLNDEISDIASFDIGIMPLFDTEWERGKSGFKLIQYMTLGIPVVASPIGFNNIIIIDGKNGFLAATQEEWYEKLSLLINNENIRNRIGKEGKHTTEKNYSFEKNSQKLLQIILDVSKTV
jgi:glycosyltransferase involved in cell wall biosynthesis